MKYGIKPVFSLLAIGSLSPTLAHPTETFGAEEQIVDSRRLIRNGRGERTATLFSVRVYDAVFYNPVAVTQDTEVLKTPFPKRLDIRYLRGFSLDDTREAWAYQFKESSGAPESQYAEGLATLQAWQKAIEKNDVHRFDLNENGTQFYINGELKGTIPGNGFRDAFLQIFFGQNPPTKALKKSLLAGGNALQ